MAFDAFMKITGIDGESQDAMHQNWIELLSFSLGVNQPKSVVSSAGSLAAERASFTDFSITKVVDKATPKLWTACAGGDHFNEVKIEICRAGGDKVKYMEYKMTDVLTTSVRKGAHVQQETLPVEEITFSYGKIELNYTETDKTTGKGKGQVAAGWDLKTNKKV